MTNEQPLMCPVCFRNADDCIRTDCPGTQHTYTEEGIERADAIADDILRGIGCGDHWRPGATAPKQHGVEIRIKIAHARGVPAYWDAELQTFVLSRPVNVESVREPLGWQPLVPSALASTGEQPAPEGPNPFRASLLARMQEIEGQQPASTGEQPASSAAVVDYTVVPSSADDDKRLATIRHHFEAYAEEHPEIIPEQRPLQHDGTGWWSDAAFLVRILNEREAELARLRNPPAAVVDYTERARGIIGESCGEVVDYIHGSEPLVNWRVNERLIVNIAAALSAVASERNAALLARLQEPDEELIAAAEKAYRGDGWKSSMRAALTKIAEVLK